jgi:tripeptide aminopeptidase
MATSIIDKKRLTDLFLELVRIKSPSGDEKEIVEKVGSILSELGLKVDIDDTGKNFDSNSGNITAFLQGSADDGRPPLFLGAHLDTVRIDGEIEPVIENGIIKNKFDYILGGDDKVAVAAIIEVLRIIRENNIPVGDIYIIFTISEEIGVVGARYINMDKVKAKYGFVFDAHGDIGTIYNQAPYQDSINAEFIGKAAHAGIEPEKGINSIKAAAAAISTIESGRIDHETTCNVGKISGGQARNIVPEKTKVIMEARSLDAGKLKKVIDGMVNALKKAAKDTGVRLDYNLYREYEGFKIKEDEPPLRAAVKALENLGIKPEISATGGGSDINIFNAKGKRAVNLSSGMEDVHTSTEYVKIDQLMLLAKLVLEICNLKIKG